MKHLVLSLLLGLAATCGVANAAEPASFSYRRVYELLYQFETLAEEKRSHLEFRARALNPFGPPPAELRIAHEDDVIRVPVDSYGLFSIPLSPQLAQLNPRMVSDPPARALRLGLAILIRLPQEGTPDAAWLLEGVRQANAAILERSRLHPARVPRARGVTLRFRPGDDASVGIIADGKAVAFTPDEEGRIDLPLDPEDHADAVISMTHRPQIIFPLFD